MARISLAPREPVGDQEAMLNAIEQTMGYLPNNLLIMAHWPELLSAFSGLGGTILHTGVIEAELKQLMAMVASTAHGCEYCQAHTSHAAHQHGASRDKVAAVFEFESSTLFTDRERAALRLAWHGALQPNQVSDSDFEALRRYFNDKEMVELVSVISLFGFLNRWSDTMASELEALPKEFAGSLELSAHRMLK